MHHPCFFYEVDFGRVAGDFRTGNGLVCPFWFDGSGVALHGEMQGVPSLGRLGNNRLALASNIGRR